MWLSRFVLCCSLAVCPACMRQSGVSRFTFFIGKGGVGKTTVSAAYALHRAAAAKTHKILLLSTDPAHSIADILDIKLSNRVVRVKTAGQLFARQLDAEQQINRFLSVERAGLLDLLNRGSLFTVEELSALLDTSLPGMAEVAALLAIHDLLDSDFDEIVVDTAPMGHAIRLFQMPGHFQRFLEVLELAALRDVVLAQHFGGKVRREPALERWSRIVGRVTDALSGEGSKLVLVTTPEPFSLNEAARSAPALAQSNGIAEVVLNRVVERKSKCPRCVRRTQQAKLARSFVARNFRSAKICVAPDVIEPILGTAALRNFAAQVFGGKKPRKATPGSSTAAAPSVERIAWPILNTALTLTLGKGGVGKTTVSAALSFHHRQERPQEGVALCSVDPAPSLDDVFGEDIGDELHPVLGDLKLRAAEVDAPARLRSWSAELSAKLNSAMAAENAGLHIDMSLDRRFILSLLEIVPPGIDELFAVFSIVRLLDSGDRVVIDMAPTGHALEVLRTPERMLAWTRVLLKTLAPHRKLTFAQDAAVEIATLSQRIRDLAAVLKDKARCRVAVVTLPESLPGRETQRLLRSLAELGAMVEVIFVNRVLIGDTLRCSRCSRERQWQRECLAVLRRQMRKAEIYLAPEFEGPIAGREALQQFTCELWQLR